MGAMSGGGPAEDRLGAEYVLPLRWPEGQDLAELTAYLAELTGFVDVTIVDGSSPAAFAQHHSAWSGLARHLQPDRWPGRNGKVRGVVTGVRVARHPLVVIADDDVRYSRPVLEQLLARLADADLVVPQNVFSAWPWHARWDTGRQLVNRAFGGDYPGTLAVRRTFVLDGYDGDVLFENLELMRTVRRRGGRLARANDVFVDRVPPSAAHFWSQRVRQAYDSLAQPGRLATEVALLPALLAVARRPGTLATAAAAAVGLGELGRRRAHGGSRFPTTAALWTPVWLVERAVCAWLALGARMLGGVRYAGGRIPRAASRRPGPAGTVWELEEERARQGPGPASSWPNVAGLGVIPALARVLAGHCRGIGCACPAHPTSRPEAPRSPGARPTPLRRSRRRGGGR